MYLLALLWMAFSNYTPLLYPWLFFGSLFISLVLPVCFSVMTVRRRPSPSRFTLCMWSSPLRSFTKKTFTFNFFVLFSKHVVVWNVCETSQSQQKIHSMGLNQGHFHEVKIFTFLIHFLTNFKTILSGSLCDFFTSTNKNGVHSKT